MREIKKKSVGPIYTIAATWLVYAMIFPLYKLWHFVIAAVVTVIIWSVSTKIFKPVIIRVPEPEPAPVSYGGEVDAIISEGKLAQQEMGRLYSCIRDPAIKKKINELMRISDKIVQDAMHDPSDVPQIKNSSAITSLRRLSC